MPHRAADAAEFAHRRCIASLRAGRALQDLETLSQDPAKASRVLFHLGADGLKPATIDRTLNLAADHDDRLTTVCS
jgi:hypothetical protein